MDEHLDQMHVTVHAFPFHRHDERFDHRRLEDFRGTGGHRGEKFPVVIAEKDVLRTGLPGQVTKERGRRNQQHGAAVYVEGFEVKDAVHHARFHEQDGVEPDSIGKFQPVGA